MATPLTPAALDTLLRLSWQWLTAYAVAVARPFALLSVFPLFTRTQLTGVLRGAVASALAVPMLPPLLAELSAGAPGALRLAVLLAKEAVIGGVIGLLLGAPFWALDLAGDVLDQQRGATQGRINDPAGFGDVSITGTLLLMTGIALFVLTGGLEVLARALYASWAVWPALGAMPSPSPAAPLLALGLLDAIMRQGLRLALPPVLAMLLADTALIVIGRFAPQLRIDDMALAARNLVFYVFMPLYCLYLIGYARQDQALLSRAIDALRPVLSSP